jgi:hypothetical protein
VSWRHLERQGRRPDRRRARGLEEPERLHRIEGPQGKAEFKFIDVQVDAIPGVPFGAKIYAKSDQGIVAPVAVQKVEAPYTDMARLRAIEGIVRVEGVVRSRRHRSQRSRSWSRSIRSSASTSAR